MKEKTALEELIRRARNRQTANLILEQAGQAASLSAGGAILLLLAGTQILDWPWLLLLFGVGLGVGAWRIGRRRPGAYETAQAVDRRLGLRDAVSTAWYFEHLDGERPSASVRQAQREQAEQLAREADARRAVPLAMPRSLYTTGALALAAFGLFALRYGIARTLDLRPPFVKVVYDAFGGRQVREQAQRKSPKPQNKVEEVLQQLGISLDTPEQKAGELEGATGAALEPADIPDVNNESAKAYQGKAGEKAGEKATGEQQAEAGEPGERSGENQGEQNSSTAAPRENTAAEPGSGSQPGQQGASGENNSLLEKLRDAMASLLNKMKIPQRTGESQQPGSSMQAGAESAQSRTAQGQKGAQGQGRQRSQSASNADSQEQAEGEGSESAQQAAGKAGDRSAEHQASKDAQSGIGKQDGNKELREAEQLAAMGKISEIIGRRSANLTGEVMVEVSSSKQQQLRTPYSQQSATHSESGGEIHRDEIPLAFQAYVQQYFEEVRKGPLEGRGSKAQPAGRRQP